MSNYALNDGIDDAEDGEDIGVSTFTGREGTIYLIDAAKYLNNPEKSITENEEHFRMCLELIEADLLKGILQNSRDLVSVVFYNTEHSPPPPQILVEKKDDDISTTVSRDNCAIFIPLSPLTKDLIQYFKNFRASEDFFDFKSKYGSSTKSHLKDAMWLCSRLIMRCNYKLFQSKVLLFTNNELPYMPQSAEEVQALVQAKDMLEHEITVDVVPIVDDFDYEQFYKEFICTINDIDMDEFRPSDPEEQKRSLLSRLYCANNRKSCLRHLNFELSDNIAMSCNIYSFTRTVRKPNAIKMFREDNTKVVVGKRVWYVEDQHEAMQIDEQNPNDEIAVPKPILPSEQFKSQNICGREIIFKPGELARMKSIQDAGLRLIGFKPIAQLKPRWMIKRCLFLYPNEKKVNGSTTLFRALWQKCLEKEKYALCTLTMRRGLSPKYVALVPQQADIHGNDGFCIIHLPLETSISALEIGTLPEPSLEQKELFKDLCKKLRFKFQPEQFGNPTLQSFYKNLEALVYDEEPDPLEDLTMPDLDRIDPKIDPFLGRIDEEFGTLETGSSESRAKRVNDGGDGGTRAKAPKKDLSLEDITNAIQNDRVEAVTVAHLKEFIKSKNAHAPSSAKKEALFELAKKLID